MWVGMSSWTCSKASMLVHEFILLMLLLVLLMLGLNDFFYEPNNKLSTFVLYPRLEFLSIHRLTPWDPRLGHLSLSLSLVMCRNEDSGWRIGVLMISVFCLEWLRYKWFFICLIMAFNSTYCDIFTSMWAFSYTLSLYLFEMWIALVLSWSCSMYHNRSILYLAFCAALFVRRLWSASIILYLLLMRLDLFTVLCHSALVVTHVCSVMVFVSSVDVTFSWLVSTPVLRWVALVIHIFLLWMASGFFVWSLMFILALVAFVPRPYVLWLALLV
jgi:hypothetical protein